MPHHHHYHDVYDDTHHNRHRDGPNARSSRHRHNRHTSRNHHGTDYHQHRHHQNQPNRHYIHNYEDNIVPYHNEMTDPFQSMENAMHTMVNSMGHNMFGGSMFGGMFPSFGHMTASPFDDMFNSAMGAMNSMQGATPPEGVHYSSWSQTRTMGPDGRVREETVQVGPGVDGRQETKRTVREGNASEMGSFGNQPFAPLLGENAADDQDVVVEEIHDDDSTGDAEVVRNVDDKEEDNGDRAQPPVSNWLKDRYNRWRSH